jgi:hypothetical protein
MESHKLNDIQVPLVIHSKHLDLIRGIVIRVSLQRPKFPFENRA